MIPYRVGWGVVVFAKIAIFAPSLAHLNPIARPIPLEAPVMITVFPLKGFVFCFEICLLIKKRRSM
jgi:hypothetical protein